MRHIIGRIHCKLKGHKLPMVIEHMGDAMADAAFDNNVHCSPVPVELRRVYCERCNESTLSFTTRVTVEGTYQDMIEGEL